VDCANCVSLLWGKTAGGESPDELHFHPLLFHMLDVGNVARCILESPFGQHWRDRLSRAFGCSIGDIQGTVPFLVALHDIGKAAAAFQGREPELWAELQRHGLEALPWSGGRFNHGAEGYAVLAGRGDAKGMLADLGLLESSDRQDSLLLTVALALGSHHGTFLTTHDYKGYPQVSAGGGGEADPHRQWAEARRALVAILQEVLVPDRGPARCEPTNLSALCVLLNGLTILCDWLGSDDQCFPPEAGSSLREYIPISKERAAKAVENRGLLRFAHLPADPSFSDLFPPSAYPDFTSRPLQGAIASLDAERLPRQALVIMEAPTGEGKTEAALHLAARLSGHGASQGLYFALPTIATSDQMYKRIRKFLQTHAEPATAPCLLPVNGQAELSEAVEEALQRLEGATTTEEAEVGVELDTWFLPRKKSLLAPYGVGTVDQAMMAALNLRHVSLRLLGLSGKIVIVDEIHAYDTYMSTIIERLLEWLRALGTTVILLSASLPPGRRADLIRAYLGLKEDDAVPKPLAGAAYPSVTLVDAESNTGEVVTPDRGDAADRSRTVTLERRPDGEGARCENAQFLLDEVAEGGCACWVCNTVGEAQKAYQCVKELAPNVPQQEQPKVILFHAQFLLKHRQDTEGRVLHMFGPGEEARPERAILIATQVVEQSLDLDFDLMMTQLAPADLIIQRMGRLQRHDRKRPARFENQEPRLVLLMPPVTEGTVDLGTSRYVYEPFVLLKTLIAFDGRGRIGVPSDVPEIVEGVYDDQLPENPDLPEGVDAQVLREAWAKLNRTRDINQQQARIRLLGAPDDKGRFSHGQDLRTMDENRGWVAAQTRLGRPSVPVVVLDADDPRLGDDGCLGGQARKLDRHEIKDLLLHSASVSKREFVQHIWAEGIRPDAFRKCPAVREYYLIITEGGSYRWHWDDRAYRLTVSHELGLLVNDEEVMQ